MKNQALRIHHSKPFLYPIEKEETQLTQNETFCFRDN